MIATALLAAGMAFLLFGADRLYSLAASHEPLASGLRYPLLGIAALVGSAAIYRSAPSTGWGGPEYFIAYALTLVVGGWSMCAGSVVVGLIGDPAPALEAQVQPGPAPEPIAVVGGPLTFAVLQCAASGLLMWALGNEVTGVVLAMGVTLLLLFGAGGASLRHHKAWGLPQADARTAAGLSALALVGIPVIVGTGVL